MTPQQPVVAAPPPELPPPAKAPPAITLPPFAVPLRTRLDCYSFVLVSAPGAWRFQRIPLRLTPRVTMISRAAVTFGSDGEIPLPGIRGLNVLESSEGDFTVMPMGGRISGHEPGKVLPLYGTFTYGPYTFILVPPTPDGLGIPPDYATITIPRMGDLAAPALLIKAGHKSVLDRMFPADSPIIRIGGSLELEVPLFRSRIPHAATLRWDESAEAFGVTVEEHDARVRLNGSGAENGLLRPHGTITVDGWELTLMPHRSRRPR